jgi:hypothetical protein
MELDTKGSDWGSDMARVRRETDRKPAAKVLKRSAELDTQTVA